MVLEFPVIVLDWSPPFNTTSRGDSGVVSSVVAAPLLSLFADPVDDRITTEELLHAFGLVVVEDAFAVASWKPFSSSPL